MIRSDKLGGGGCLTTVFHSSVSVAEHLDTQTRKQIHDAEARVARLADELRRAEGQRDRLLREALDNEGLHDQRKSMR